MKSILLIGLGRLGHELAVRLCEMGHEVMACDIDEEKVNKVMPYVTNAKIGDSIDPDFLESLGVNNYDVCFVTMHSDFQNSLETTSLLKDLGAKYVISRAESDIHEKFLLRNGADHVIFPEKQMAKWSAIRYASDDIINYIELDDEYSIVEIEIPDGWVGEKISKLPFMKKYNINILAIKSKKFVTLKIDPEYELTDKDKLVVLGTLKSIKKCFK